MSKVRVFIGMTEVAGYFSSLAHGFRKEGYDVNQFQVFPHRFAYANENASLPPILSAYQKLCQRKAKEGAELHAARRLALTFQIHFVRFASFVWAAFFFDVFVFGFGSSFLPKRLDLFFLKYLFKKRVISVVALGSEARPPFMDGIMLKDKDSFIEVAEIARATRNIKSLLGRIERYSDVVVAAPLTSQFLRKPCVNFFELGLPYAPKSDDSIAPSEDSAPRAVRILHSPSCPALKGTYDIHRAIRDLQQRYEIEFVEITNKPNHVVIEEIKKCDFVVDQLYSDTVLPALATEAAFHQKPVVIAGYGWDQLERFVDPSLMKISHLCRPEEILKGIEKLIVEKDYRLALGERAYQFVSKNWDAAVVAEKFVRLIDGNIPARWWFDPLSVNYIFGVGVNQRVLHKGFSDFLKTEGESAFCLDDRPDLLASIRSFLAEKAIGEKPV